MLNKILRERLLASTFITGALLVGAPAFAQTQPADTATADTAEAGSDIVVTGTLIRNPNLQLSSPVNVTTSDEIELKQSNTAESLLREIPGIVPSIGSAVNNGNGGGSFVNLRGLGSNRNIVVIDGVRLTPFDLLGRFDLNNIPVALVERVDVLTGGSATTYGADAVSGVVNFITKQDFSGVELTAAEQINERGDGNTFRIDATIGANFDDGRGNAVFSIGYQVTDPVYQGDRTYSLQNYDSFSGASSGSGTAVPSRFSLPGAGTQQIDPATGALRATYSLFNFNPYNIFQTPFKRFNMYGAAHYELTDNIEVYTRGLFSKNTVNTIIAPSGAFALPVSIPLSNPYMPAAARAQFCAANGISVAACNAAATATSPTDPNYRTITTNLSRRTTEVGPRISDFTTTYFDYRLGFRGSITDSISWDIFGSYGESDNIQTQKGYTLNSRFRQALLATNTTTCLTDTNGCVPVNVFGAQGAITPAMVDFLTGESQIQTRTTLAQARATVSGDFGVSSPWASNPISFAVGGEYRKYTAKQASDLLSQSGDLGGSGGAAPNIDGGFDVYEAFGELIAPIVEDKPLFKSLTLEAGVRYSHYTIDAPGNPKFNTTTWKAGGSWEPVGDIKIRGNYAHSVRAPNINELFSPVNTTLTNLANDPCARVDANGASLGLPALSGELRAVCLAQGATAATINTIPVPTSGQINTTGGGNIDLKPEKSNSWTVGFVLTPSFLPGFSATVDYYKIKVTGAIASQTPGDAIIACFGAPGAGGVYTPAAGASTSAACTSIGRDPLTGSLSGDASIVKGIPQTLTNLGTLDTDGIDLTLNYKRDLGFANLALGFVGNWTNHSRFNSNPAAGAENRECVGLYSVNCASPQPKFQWSQRTTLSFKGVDVSLLWRHIDKLRYEDGDAYVGALVGGNLAGKEVDFNKIPAYNYFDISTRFDVADNLTLTFTVQNMFDKQPPLVGSTLGSTAYNSGNTYPSTYDAMGRRYGIQARLRF